MTLSDVIDYVTQHCDAYTACAVLDVISLSQRYTFDRDYIKKLCENVHLDVLNGRV